MFCDCCDNFKQLEYCAILHCMREFAVTMVPVRFSSCDLRVTILRQRPVVSITTVASFPRVTTHPPWPIATTGVWGRVHSPLTGPYPASGVRCHSHPAPTSIRTPLTPTPLTPLIICPPMSPTWLRRPEWTRTSPGTHSSDGSEPTHWVSSMQRCSGIRGRRPMYPWDRPHPQPTVLATPEPPYTGVWRGHPSTHTHRLTGTPSFILLLSCTNRVDCV